MNRLDQLNQSINQKKCIKIIAGINNFDIDNVKQVIMAAEKGGANAVDIAAREDIIKMAKETINLPVFVSSVKPAELAMAMENGADALEVGNFDVLYSKGERISAKEVLDLATETVELVGREMFLSVTIPGHLDISEQIELAKNLEELNVNLIQTEGAATVDTNESGAKGLLQKAHVSIANSIDLIKHTEIPIMTASGLTSITTPLAFATGVSAIGVGSCVNKLNSAIEMTAAVMAIVESVKTKQSSIEDTVSV